MGVLLVVLVLGLLLYFFPHGQPKVDEIGRLMIACALLALLIGHADGLSRLLR